MFLFLNSGTSLYGLGSKTFVKNVWIFLCEYLCEYFSLSFLLTLSSPGQKILIFKEAKFTIFKKWIMLLIPYPNSLCLTQWFSNGRQPSCPKYLARLIPKSGIDFFCVLKIFIFKFLIYGLEFPSKTSVPTYTPNLFMWVFSLYLQQHCILSNTLFFVRTIGFLYCALNFVTVLEFLFMFFFSPLKCTSPFSWH